MRIIEEYPHYGLFLLIIGIVIIVSTLFRQNHPCDIYHEFYSQEIQGKISNSYYDYQDNLRLIVDYNGIQKTVLLDKNELYFVKEKLVVGDLLCKKSKSSHVIIKGNSRVKFSSNVYSSICDSISLLWLLDQKK